MGYLSEIYWLMSLSPRFFIRRVLQLYTVKSVNMKNFLCCVLMALTVYCQALAQPSASLVPKVKGYAPVNGLKIYYETYGEGSPIVLLHGAFMTIGMNWQELLPLLSQHRRVIALEMQGHGHTADIDRPFGIDAFASDVAGVLQYLHIPKATILGYSMGGTVAIQFSIRYPAMVDKLIVISSVYKKTGWLPAVQNAFDHFDPSFFDQTPLMPAYKAVAPDTAHWHAFVKKMIVFDKTSFDLGENNIRALKMPVLLLMGDNDGTDPVETAKFYQLLGGGVSADMMPMPASRWAVLPGKSHVSLMMDTPAVFGLVDSFLK